MTHGDIIQNSKGMWVTEVYENGKYYARLEWTTKAGLIKKLLIMGAR